MATKTTLPTNFQDDILATTANGRRKYNIINNADGTISLEDVTEYTQTGSDYGAKQINAINNTADWGVLIFFAETFGGVQMYICGDGRLFTRTREGSPLTWGKWRKCYAS